ncbi:MAG: glycosyltransferase [Flavobacteriaceae bacterium]
MKKKLLIINKAQFGYHIDTYYYCKFLSKDFDITYVCFDEKKEKITNKDINVVYCSYDYKYFMRVFSFFKLIIKSYFNFKPNVVFIKYFLGSVFTLLFIRRSKVILDIRTGNVSGSLKKRIRKDKILKIEASFFKNITVISKGLKERLKLKYNTCIIPLGAIQISSREKDYKSMKLLYVGTFENRKIEVTVKAVAKFVKEIDENISYQIVGFGSDKETQLIKQTIEQNQLADKVSLEGRIPVNQLKKYFDSNNIGIAYIPITDYYANQPPTKIFEYAMSGLINVATKTTINKTLINENNGVLCDDNIDALFEALKKVNNKLPSYKYNEITDSLKDYQWQNIIINQLNPLLKSIADAA